MESTYVTLEFPRDTDTAVDAAVARYKELTEVAKDFGGSAATWKVTEGWFSYRFKRTGSAARFQSEVVPLPSGWAMRVGPL